MFRVPSGGKNGQAKGSTAWEDEAFAGFYPSLAGWLGLVRAEDGTERVPGTLLVFTEGGRVKGCLTDRQSEQRAFLSATSWEELLGAIEKTLSTGDGDWRPVKSQGKR